MITLETLAQELAALQLNLLPRLQEIEKRLLNLEDIKHDAEKVALEARVKTLEDVREVQKSINSKLLSTIEKKDYFAPANAQPTSFLNWFKKK